MKNYIFIMLLCISIISCQERKTSIKSEFYSVVNSYINDYPINIKDYNYIIRYYMKNSDTIMEISQDKKYEKYPSDFNLYITSEIQNSPYKLNKGIKYIGAIKVNEKQIYIYDTDKNLGNMFYGKEIIKSEINLPKKISQIDYPFLPKKRIYKFKKNNLILIKETDTIKFK